MTNFEHLPVVTSLVTHEVRHASRKHSPMNSLHEGYAVILEELDEVWDEVKKRSENRDLTKVRDELVQVAAMAVRTILDCCGQEK